MHHAGSRRRRRAPSQHRPGLAAAPPSAPLPAAWTSLSPIVLPPFSLAEFPVPPALLPIFQAAGAEYDVPWEVLAAVNEVETGYGRDAHRSSAGAIGFMQFLPSTWGRWGRDADGDQRRDPRDPVDAVFSAARYLHAAGAATDLASALFDYNHAGWYVRRVITRARELAGIDAKQVAALTRHAIAVDRRTYRTPGGPFFGRDRLEPTPGEVLLMTRRELARLVLHDARLDIYPCGRQDIAMRRIDARVLATLEFLARSGFRLRISSLRCGHRLLTTTGNVSAHSFGAAVDIAAVDGTPILGHQGPGSIADRVLRRLLRLQGLMRPAQIISLMTVAGATNTLALPDHADHLHVGFGRPVRLPLS